MGTGPATPRQARRPAAHAAEPRHPRTCLAVLQLALFGAGGIRAADGGFQSFFDQELDVLFQALKRNRGVSVNKRLSFLEAEAAACVKRDPQM